MVFKAFSTSCRLQVVSCHIDEAVGSHSLCHITEIAIRLNRKVTWDPLKEHFPGDGEANFRLRGGTMRAPWHV